MKPLVFLYRTAFGFYFYETSRNEIVKVSQALYEFIQAILAGQGEEEIDASENVKAEYRELRECGYLSPPHVQMVHHPLTEGLDIMLKRKVDKITLQVTQDCNLRCSYCIYSEGSNFGQRTHTHKSMSLSTAKKALDFYRKNSPDTEKVSIGFYGGEPLLKFDLIKDVVAYAEEIFRGKEIIYSITTNATLLNDEVIDFLLNHKFKILISIDGPERVQNKNRRFRDGTGSYQKVMQNVSKMYNKDPDRLGKVTLSMVIDPAQDYNEITTLFYEPVMKNVGLLYSFVEEDAQTLLPSQEYVSEHNYAMFLAFVMHFRNNDKTFPSKLVEQDIIVYKDGINRFKTSILPLASAPSGPCVPGKSKLFVSCTGDLYPCERVNENNCMKIGSLEEGFDLDNIKTILNVSKLNGGKCKTCWAFSLCTVCVKRADDNGRLSEKKMAHACEEARRIAINKIANKVLAFENECHERKMTKMC